MQRILLLSVFIISGCVTTTQQQPDWDSVATVAQEEIINNELCLLGCPVGNDAENIVVDHDIYILSLNFETKFADWVAYQIKAEYLRGGSHPRNWRQDPDIPDDIAMKPSDYTGAYAAYDYDRGHQAPLASFSNHPEWATTNLLSNISPQKAPLNRGQWATIESRERTLARHVDAVYVATGTVYLHEMPSLPQASIPHIVPSGYWKVIAVEDDDQIKVASFYLDQDTPRRGDYCEHTVTLDEVERLSGLSFFAAEPDIQMTSLLVDVGCGAALIQ